MTSEKIYTMKTVPSEEHLSMGSVSCAGCGALLILRYALKVLGKNTYLVTATGCGAVIMQMGVPKVPHIHPLFENGPAIASGIDSALKVQGKRDKVNILVFAGDGATADIGLSSLSGAVERDDKMIYICYDNESYMNTGVQRSSTTPKYALTTTTPKGKKISGEEHALSLSKNVAEMMVAQGCKYVATASPAYPFDLMTKIERAKEIDGVSYIHVLSPCPPGWGHDTRITIKLAKLAVLTGYFLLWEQKMGKRTYQHLPKRLIPIEEYLKLQRRFTDVLSDETKLKEYQDYINEKFARCWS